MEVIKGLEAAVIASFAADQTRSLILTRTPRITGAAMKERVEKCRDIFKKLRGDLHWSVTRCLDHLPQFLQKELDGDSWESDAMSLNRHNGWIAKQ